MAFLFQFSRIISTLFLMITYCIASNDQTPKPYIVYMGSPLNNSGDTAEIAELTHLQMLSSVIPSEESERISLRHSYHHAYRGFCALLTEEEATLLSRHEEVVSVFPDPILQLHTTRSWDFLGVVGSSYSSYHYNHASSYDVIIGVIDTGIWPESPSFDDQHIGEVPSRWKGVCMEGFDFAKSNCNRKLIGARFYNIGEDSSIAKLAKNTSSTTTIPSKPNGTPRDKEGHGTHTASIAAGAFVPNATYFGLASGIARGGSPSARVATYKACSEGNSQGSAILKAIDDAIKDGVDIISISIGRSFVFQTDFKDDPIAIGAFHAAERGVVVVCSGGNEGPDPYTVTNSAPWIFTVAASTIDRKFQSNVVLGNNVSLKGTGISFNPTGRSKTYPLAFGDNIPFHPSLTSQARYCMPGSLDAKRVAGKIIVCMNDDWSISREIKKLVVKDADAKGLILIDEQEKTSPFDSGNFPFAEFGKLAGAQILQYINSSQNPLATIYPANEILRFKPAPVVADFSSRGPATLTENILKPDITAPGVGILSAMIPNQDEKKSSLFGITSGTSMACPHVSGAMAFIKSIHPTWSFSMIKSAIMTTATISNNLGNPLTNTSSLHASPHEIGAGELNPIKALNPGLVFETTMNDYYNFLCYYGYKEKELRLVVSKKNNFDCPRNANTTKKELISHINYPSISVEKLKQNQGVMRVKRVVTNVGSPYATYTSSVIAPPGLVVNVYPRKIAFVKGIKKASFEVSFDGKKASMGYNFGIITWSDGSHKVQMVYAVNVE
ncbi:CO(2)-response secreted protease-like [Lycium barbarum]|uniref:CO(2)-response secreted protease-like n=1 Tax=Lycium barbarum TaxID=112863 RepID=UPI00293EF8C2|nr:CO(2)-response secreted protease-like [Lycium barbarum]